MPKEAWNRIVLRFALALAASAWLALGQQPPQGVEESLRARVKQFYDLQMQGKFRASEACVCDDTKDYYYELNKKGPIGYEITGVEFSRDFKSAVVRINIRAEAATMAGTFPIVAPVATLWKFENGAWCFYLPEEQQKTVRTPFGNITRPTPGQPEQRQAGGAAPFRAVKPAEVMSGVSVSADSVVFDPAKAAKAEILFTNSLPGRVELGLKSILPAGVQVKFSATEIPSKGIVSVQFLYTPASSITPPDRDVVFEVEPTRQRIPVTVRFDRPQPPESAPGSPAPARK